MRNPANILIQTNVKKVLSIYSPFFHMSVLWSTNTLPAVHSAQFFNIIFICVYLLQTTSKKEVFLVQMTHMNLAVDWAHSATPDDMPCLQQISVIELRRDQQSLKNVVRFHSVYICYHKEFKPGSELAGMSSVLRNQYFPIDSPHPRFTW